ncbi:MAG TPA: DUF4442 domain-containing protein [Pseudomonadota bacterium]|jgi:uncharacterized protein (TIGR00369 family)|nr:DUF4442 domain-containing protein [Pseudomonadota bacterium]HND11790.1 DUF4442 domain-containing protein [Pseudomonadota bacterium]HNF99022.1 DUF4442 domain-containing protein [Pseudomonadota bacterium]HNI58999.1 DUF4442 domain-containing protein [Pseudomonadota bacterium]HNN49498.1 DUF4442 domain-containing protein [Pseudomonadota bacterium]
MNPADVFELVTAKIPMVQKLGLKAVDLSPSAARILLPFDSQLGNHGGTVHVGAQFVAAETAALSAGLLFLNGMDVTCHSKGCELRFRKPARGDLWASAQLGVSDPSELKQRLVAEGKVDVAVLVDVTDTNGERVTEGTVTLSLRRL